MPTWESLGGTTCPACGDLGHPGATCSMYHPATDTICTCVVAGEDDPTVDHIPVTKE